MRTSTIVFLMAATLILSTTACSGGGQRPATQVRNYGPEAATSGQYAQAPAPAPGYAPPAPQPAPGAWPQASATGGFQWHGRLADAQAAARAQGKLILAMSTKPNCGLCDKFKTQVVPQTSAQCDRIAVGYIYNILNPETPQVDRTLRANLQGASLMPLVGFLTPDLRWVHGFWGARSVAQFQGDIAQAQRIYPVSAGVVRTMPTGPTLAAVQPVINEYGEPEWSLAGDVWPVEDPEPIDAITGEPGAEPATATVDASQAGTALADAGPAPTVAAAPARPMTYVGIRPPMPPEAAVEPQPRRETVPTPAATPAPAAPAAPASARATWADEQLALALRQIRLGDYDAARSTLDGVRTRLPESTHAREASKGYVALYNARRIQGAASGDERMRYLSRANRDLGSSMWSVLFKS